MKKIVLLMSTLALVISSCADKNAYTIVGKMPASVSDNIEVYLQKMGDDLTTTTNIDTAVVAGGVFKFKGIAQNEPMLGFVTFVENLDEKQKDISTSANVIIEPGKIEIVFDIDHSTAKGTVGNNSLQALSDKGITFGKRGYIEVSEKTTMSEKETKSTLIDFLKENIHTQAGVTYFLKNSYLFNYDELSQLASAIRPQYESNKQVLDLKKRIAKLEPTREGVLFTDLKGKTPNGKDIALSDYAGKGKIVLVDFWASWCPPCRRDMPAVVELYKTYKDKGFEIVGISLDSDVDKWKNGISELNVTWPQISDLKAWDSELSQAYAVYSIPHTVLIDGDGKIIARGLGVKGLREKLEELFK